LGIDEKGEDTKRTAQLLAFYQHYFRGEAEAKINEMKPEEKAFFLEKGYIKISSKSLKDWMEKLTENQFETLAAEGKKKDKSSSSSKTKSEGQKLIEDDLALSKAIHAAQLTHVRDKKAKTSALEKLYLRCANPVWEVTEVFLRDYKALCNAVFEERIQQQEEENDDEAGEEQEKEKEEDEKRKEGKGKDKKTTRREPTEPRVVFHDEKVVIFVKNQTSAGLLELFLAPRLARKGICYSLCNSSFNLFFPFYSMLTFSFFKVTPMAGEVLYPLNECRSFRKSIRCIGNYTRGKKRKKIKRRRNQIRRKRKEKMRL